MENNYLIEKIKAALEPIRPYLVRDGGDVRVVRVTEDFCVEVELLGACANCDISSLTMKAGVEEAIKRMVPEIKGVIAING